MRRDCPWIWCPLQISLKSTHCGIYLRFISASFALISIIVLKKNKWGISCWHCMLANQFVLQKLCWFWREFDWWLHLIENLGRNSINYFLYWWWGLCTPPVACMLRLIPPHSSSSSISCISTKPVYSTSSVTWLTLILVLSDIETKVFLMSGWMVADSTGRFS